MRIWTVLLLLVLVGPILLPPVALGKDPVADARTQLTTTRFHAGELAQRGTAISATQTHLRHVINCFEGPQGKNFNAAAGYPCQGQGSGILNDLQAASGNAKAEKALRFANAAYTVALQGAASNDINEAQPYAAVVAKQVDSALDALK